LPCCERWSRKGKADLGSAQNGGKRLISSLSGGKSKNRWMFFESLRGSIPLKRPRLPLWHYEQRASLKRSPTRWQRIASPISGANTSEPLNEICELQFVPPKSEKMSKRREKGY